MPRLIAALPMYDWPERVDQVDSEWERLREALLAAGLDAPERLVRRNADMPGVPGGIRDAEGNELAPDPALLPPDELNFHSLWLHPDLLLAQTCWGPMETGLARHVRLLGQPDYSHVEGGRGEFYSSAMVARREGRSGDVAAPADGRALLPLDRLRGSRLAFNSTDSMSGSIALSRDLSALGESLDIFADRIVTGGHRKSVRAVAEGLADVAAIDCMSWSLARRFEPAARELHVIGWTAHRKGLPFIGSSRLPEPAIQSFRTHMLWNSAT